MKLTEQYIKQLIKEELEKTLSEAKQEFFLTYKGKKVSLSAIEDVLQGGLTKNNLEGLKSGARKMGSMGMGNWEVIRNEGRKSQLMTHTGIPDVKPVTKRGQRGD